MRFNKETKLLKCNAIGINDSLENINQNFDVYITYLKGLDEEF